MHAVLAGLNSAAQYSVCHPDSSIQSVLNSEEILTLSEILAVLYPYVLTQLDMTQSYLQNSMSAVVFSSLSFKFMFALALENCETVREL